MHIYGWKISPKLIMALGISIIFVFSFAGCQSLNDDPVASRAKANKKEVKKIKSYLVLLADAERQYHKQHGKYTSSITPLVLINERIGRLSLKRQADITVDNNIVTLEEAMPLPEDIVFVYIQSPDKKVRVCTGIVGCKNGRWTND